jgi:hypothetical protein
LDLPGILEINQLIADSSLSFYSQAAKRMSGYLILEIRKQILGSTGEIASRG